MQHSAATFGSKPCTSKTFCACGSCWWLLPVRWLLLLTCLSAVFSCAAAWFFFQFFVQVVDVRSDHAGLYRPTWHYLGKRALFLNFALLLSAPGFCLFSFLRVPLLALFVPCCWLCCWRYMGPGHWWGVSDLYEFFWEYCTPFDDSELEE